MVPWFIRDKASSMRWTNISDVVQVTLYDGGVGDGRQFAASGWESTQTVNNFRDVVFDDAAASFEWSPQTPELETIDDYSFDVPLTLEDSRTVAKDESVENFSFTQSVVSVFDFLLEDVSSVETTIENTQSFGWSVEVTVSYTPPEALGGYGGSITAGFSGSRSNTFSKTDTTTTTTSVSQSIEYSTPPRTAATARLTATSGKIPPIVTDITAMRWYIVPVKNGVQDPSNNNWYKRPETFRLRLNNNDMAFRTSFEVSETPMDPAVGPSCFSGRTLVEVLGKGTLEMKDLAVDDKILVGDTYEAVYGFAHMQRTQASNFLEIHAGDQSPPLEITGEHLLLVNDVFLPAKLVRVGDILQSGNGGDVVVTKVNSIQRTGLYAPLTSSGTLLVNGIKASAYITLQPDAKAPAYIELQGSVTTLVTQHSFIHMVLSPVHIVCTGILPSLCSNAHMNEETGYLSLVGIGLDFANLMNSQSIVGQVFVLVLVICSFGPVYLAESIVGAVLVPIIVVLAGLAAAVALGFLWWWQPVARKLKSV